ncbi:MAG: septum site-determining protein MinC [Clostridiales bacterium]|uniref:septum site-determining protein MinC n=1 Tax=Terrisporobacter sp. TaxID=1965305 RepID=UPI002A46910B|nr:septum site-determining protein MinC [Terrisporobacter sp.]MCI6459729.1 septum site-determining protein MinC [Clostridium sp.]MDD5877724.1 septum site-determining protein MinC [Clostridiales bacterium]MCI7206932.1 septum site-determining protein MinC [Clostridium sp.]MDD7757311.1 septum site-determining protein MinC [Clostridiales bacterium]MDY4137380.1 septum site-determining protein MinC [Terrisporobacter sp.]
MSLRKYSTEELIEFKGNKKGLIINIKKVAPFEQVKESIIDRLEENVGFFNGAKIYQINSDYLNDVQMMMIEDAITSRFDIEFVEEKDKETYINTYETKYVDNMRSGEKVVFDGDVVVMSDMNPGSQVSSTRNVVVMGNINSGAKVVANGNIVVMGEVRGFVHAGAKGNDSAYVIANSLCPKILQIADNIAEAPDDEYEESKNDKIIIPEIAFVSKDRIVIESFLPKTLKNKEIYRG